MFKGLMTGVSGVRGIIGEGMSPEVAQLWASGFGTWVGGQKVVVSRDSRPTGEMLLHTVKAGLMSAGCDVDDAGIVPTPTGAMAVERRGGAGGIIITASHNPQQWNALKFVRPDGRMLTADDFFSLEQIVVNGPLKTVSWDRIGRVFDWDGANEMYLRTVLGIGILDLDRVRRRKYRIAFDGVNGAGSILYPELLEALGCEVIKINCDNSGLFPRPPEPQPANITELCRVVVDNKCHLGFAVDPDGDRLSAVDETGHPIGEELTLAMAVKAVLTDKPGPVVINCLTSQLLEDIAAQFGVPSHRTKVGEANVAAMMSELDAVVGGEGNGGVILSEVHLVRDSGIGMALLLNYLSKSKRKLSEHIAEFPVYVMRKTSYPIDEFDASSVLDELVKLYKPDQINLIDGVRVVTNTGWVQARASNTEPILRIYAESPESRVADGLLTSMISNIDNIIKANR